MDGDSDYPAMLADRYRLGQTIGEGGMGAVFECIDTQSPDPRKLAVKLVKLEQLLSPAGLQRFRYECETLTKLDHPNIVKTYDYGFEDEWPFLVMELCRDRGLRPTTLKSLQERFDDRRLPPDLLQLVIPQILSALTVVHDHDLIHRDVKPDNFLVRESLRGSISLKLTDFGLAMEGGVVSSMAGTFDYMSPEQRAGDALDARSDVYSAGLMIYRLATGYERLGYETPSDVDPAIPEWVDALVDAAVKDNRAERPADARELAQLVPPAVRAAAHAALASANRNPIAARGVAQDDDRIQLHADRVDLRPEEILVDHGLAQKRVKESRPTNRWVHTHIALGGYFAGIGLALLGLLFETSRFGLTLGLVDLPARALRAVAYYGCGILPLPPYAAPGSDYMVGSQYLDEVWVIPYLAVITGIVGLSLSVSLAKSWLRLFLVLGWSLFGVFGAIPATQPWVLGLTPVVGAAIPFLWLSWWAMQRHWGYGVYIPAALAGLSGAILISSIYGLPDRVPYPTDRGSTIGSGIACYVGRSTALPPPANWVPGKWPGAALRVASADQNPLTNAFVVFDQNGKQITDAALIVDCLDATIPARPDTITVVDGQPLSRPLIRLSSDSDGGGQYTLDLGGLPYGHYRVWVQGYPDRYNSFRYQSGGRIATYGVPWQPTLTYDLGFLASRSRSFNIEALTSMLLLVLFAIVGAMPIVIILTILRKYAEDSKLA